MSEKSRFTEEEARVVLIGAWLARYDNLYPTYGVRLEDRPTIFDDFEAALADLPVVLLEAAFTEWRRVGTRFPVPADIRGLIMKHIESVETFEAEQAWDLLRWKLDFFNWSPDNGFLPIFVDKAARLTTRVQEHTTQQDYNGGMLLKTKPWDERTNYAIRQCGGLQRIAEVSGSEHDFVRKAFLLAHRRYSETAGFKQIGRDEATGLLGNLKKGITE